MALIHFLPVPEIGHATPAIAIARQLLQRGHRVEMLVFPSIELYVRDSGIPTLSLAKLLPANRCLDAPGERRALAYVAGTGDLAAFIERHRPDLVVTDIVLCGYSLWYRRFGIPAMALSSMLPDRIDRDVLTPSARSRPGRGLWAWCRRYVEFLRLTTRAALDRWNDWEGIIAAAREEGRRQGLPDAYFRERGSLATLQLPIPTMVACSECFDYPRKPNRLRSFVGPCIDLERSETPSGWTRLASPKPLVVCCFGSQAHRLSRYPAFLAMLAAVAQRHPEWSFVASSEGWPRDALPRSPDNLLVDSYLPQMLLLRRAAVSLTHGGMSSIKEAIVMGVPMGVFPWGYDQVGNAARVVYHGVGVATPLGRVTERQLERMVSRLVNDAGFRVRVRRMGNEFLRDQERSKAVLLIEATLRQARS